ncbi:phage integrase N-terminal SAM-like domain-containing protein [Colwellia marinimaniae]|uniref:Integron integrase n=1 Tax=Colwellia marinimaniae TaxID=1513592 RepID=A0ABQ0MTC3_9GAMM|nr:MULTISPECIES: phage integrase N-terminal SAM-like domain-containing protein [Colwellia]GAW95598.1 integron integrase [Colwellia marinimaniae]
MSTSPFLESIRHILRTKHYSIQTEKAYLLWIKCFIIFNHKRHPKDMGEQEVSNYLTYIHSKDLAEGEGKTSLHSGSTRKYPIKWLCCSLVLLSKRARRINPSIGLNTSIHACDARSYHISNIFL